MHCGAVPIHEDMCRGYRKNPLKCKKCNSGLIGKDMKVKSGWKWVSRYQRLPCDVCFGTGHEPKYICKIRYYSDSASFADSMNWESLLKKQLDVLLQMSKPYWNDLPSLKSKKKKRSGKK